MTGKSLGQVNYEAREDYFARHGEGPLKHRCEWEKHPTPLAKCAYEHAARAVVAAYLARSAAKEETGSVRALPQSDKLEICGATLILLTAACPEQYDVYSGSRKIGYLRLRGGHFTAQYPDCPGEVVYDVRLDKQGIFTDEERAEYIPPAVKALLARDCSASGSEPPS